LYSPERQALFGLIEHYIPSFSKQKILDIILKGVNLDNEDFLSTNISLSKAVQKFKLLTNRFSKQP
jgi:hypothetical protein